MTCFAVTRNHCELSHAEPSSKTKSEKFNRSSVDPHQNLMGSSIALAPLWNSAWQIFCSLVDSQTDKMHSSHT